MGVPKRVGSGWHKQSVRHSNARRLGRAGGKYSNVGRVYKTSGNDIREERLLLKKLQVMKKDGVESFNTSAFGTIHIDDEILATKKSINALTYTRAKKEKERLSSQQKAFEKYEKTLPKKKVVSTPVENSRFNAGEILRQLGGNRFIAMTGAKNFIRNDNKQNISFKIGRNSKSINHVRITLNSMDTYDMEFIRIRGDKMTVVSRADGVYNDMLQSVFTEHTGMYTSL